MNVFIFTGNLGKDAEVKVLAGGASVCEFSVAVKSGYGEKEKTNWVRCAMFGKRAEGQLPQYLKKGTQVAITGELELQEWEGQNGKGAAMAVKVSELNLIGGKQQGEQGQQAQIQQAPQQAPNQQGYAQPQQAPQQSYQQALAQQQQPPQNQGFQQQSPSSQLQQAVQTTQNQGFYDPNAPVNR